MSDVQTILSDLESQGLVGEAGAPPIPSPSNPMAVARRLARDLYTDHGKLLLRAHRGDFYRWNGTCWPEAEARGVRGAMMSTSRRPSTRGLPRTGPSLFPGSRIDARSRMY